MSDSESDSRWKHNVCQTFFFIPDRILGFPVFGFGWLLLIWGAASLVWVGWLIKKTGWSSEIKELIPFLLLTGAAIVFLFPLLEVKAPNGEVLGLPIRGYGTLLMSAVVAGWGLSAWRAVPRGFSVDTITSLGLPGGVAGIFGARLFFVIEYWPDFRRATWLETLQEILDFTKGGLVVYGSMIGAFLAFAWFARRRRLSIFALGDVIAPGVVLGMAIGRIGCLMNGCCYGGLCEHGGWCIQFPHHSSVEQQAVSPPYQHQLATGRLFGFVLSENGSHQPIVKSVVANGPAERSGLTAGARIAAINGTSTPNLDAAQKVLARSGPEVSVELADRQRLKWSIGSLPPRTLPVHPSQIYSAISSFLICLVLLSSEPYFHRRGAVFALLLTLYPVLRFFEEMIRDDEPAQWGTALTISQLISLAVLVAALVTWAYVLKAKPASSP